MARQVFYEIREKDVLLHEPFIYLRQAIAFAKSKVRAVGKASSAYLCDPSDGGGSPSNHPRVEVRLYGDANFLLTIDEV